MPSQQRDDDSHRRPRRVERPAERTAELPQFVTDKLDLEAVQRTARETDRLTDEDRETIAALVDLGVGEAEARDAVLGNRVPLVLTQELFGDTPRYDFEQVTAKAGLPPEVFRQVRAAIGLPPADRFTRTDLTWAKQIADLLEILPVEAVVRSARARGSALSAAVMADLSTIREELVLPMRRSGADDLTVAVALAETARELRDTSEELLTTTYRLLVEHLVSSEIAAIAARSAALEVDIAVGFIDVVGYTALSARVDPEGLDEVLDAFQQRVVGLVADTPDVAAVKYLGDAVMLIGPDARTLAQTMLDLTVETEELEDAPLRGGLAAGETLVREGDYFGPTVNMAARLTDIARPWSLLAAEELVDELSEVFDVKRILPTRIRGVGLRRPLVVRRPADA